MTTPTFNDGKKEATEETQNFTIMELCCSISTFNEDPPDTPFQHGYLEGLYDLLYLKLARAR